MPQDELPAPSAHHQVESEAAPSNEAELNVIQSLEVKPHLIEKVKHFQAGCIKSHFSEWASYTMNNEIL